MFQGRRQNEMRWGKWFEGVAWVTVCHTQTDDFKQKTDKSRFSSFTFKNIYWGLGRSLGGGHANPLQYPHLENLHGQRSLAGYSPWGRKESLAQQHISKTYSSLRRYKKRERFESSLYSSSFLENVIWISSVEWDQIRTLQWMTHDGEWRIWMGGPLRRLTWY